MQIIETPDGSPMMDCTECGDPYQRLARFSPDVVLCAACCDQAASDLVNILEPTGIRSEYA